MDSVKIEEDLLIPAGRHTLDPDEVRARQRERLVRAMGLCVSERGYAATTIGDVVRVARTSRTVFYRHFDDKEACFLETYRQMTRTRINASLAAAGRVGGWREKLHEGIGAYFRWMAEHPEVAITTVVEVHRAGDAALQARSQAMADWRRTLVGVAQIARAGGEPVNPSNAAYAAILLTAEAAVHEYALDGRLEQVGEQALPVQRLAALLFESSRGGG